jgi:hypothetical protein
MRKTLAIPLAIATTAVVLGGCMAGGGAPPPGTRPIIGPAAYGGCPPVNIGTAENPRLVRDPACGTS